MNSSQASFISERFRVGVLVLNRNGLQWLKTCLPSLVNSAARGFRIFVVDNGSTDGSIEYVRLHFPQFRVLHFESNLGFARAYNEAIKLVSADYIVLLNNDTAVLSNDWIEQLVKVIERNTRVAAVQCKLLSFNEPDKLDSVGVTGEKYWQGFTDIGKFEPDRKQYDFPPITPFSICAGGALIRRSTFLEVGGFDSQLFAYHEDVDFSWRLRLAGYVICYQPLARIAHASHGSFRHERDALRTYLSRRNLLRILLKNCGKDTLLWALRNYLIHSSLMFSAYLVMRDRKTFAVIKALLWNIVSFKDTYSKRLAIQSGRNISELEILRAMYQEFEFHPLRYEKLHRILNRFLAGGRSDSE
jgi:GT2 family glycosyltransferase